MSDPLPSEDLQITPPNGLDDSEKIQSPVQNPVAPSSSSSSLSPSAAASSSTTEVKEKEPTTRPKRKSVASLLFEEMSQDESIRDDDKTLSNVLLASDVSKPRSNSTESMDEERDSFVPEFPNMEKPAETVQRIRLDREKSRTKSFSEIDLIKDYSTWHMNRPSLPMNERRHSYRGTQTYSSYNREFYFPRSKSDEFEKMFLVWVMVTVLAVLITIVGLLIDFGVMCTSFAVYGFSQTLVIDAYDEEDAAVVGGAFVVYAFSAAFFSCLAGILVVYFAPLAEGSGIPDTKSYLNGVHLTGLFSIPTLIAKSVGCAFSIGSGLIAGREGPIIHVGAIIGSALSQGSSNFFRFRLTTYSSVTRHFRSAEWKRDFAVMGSACGVASAFMAPMGGVLFAIEEGATVWRQQLTFLCLYCALFTGFLTSVVKGYLNHSNEPPPIPGVLFGSYREESPNVIFDTNDLPFVLLIGVIGGLVGSSFSALQRILMRWRKKHIRVSKIRTICEVVLVSLLVSTGRYWIPYIWGKCIDDHHFHEAQGDHNALDGTPDATPFHCGEHKGNDLGFLFWVPQEHMLKWVLHSPYYDDISTAQLIYAFIFYFLFTLIVFGIAVPSGLFIPAFVIGATYGRLVGQLASWQIGHDGLLTSYTFLGCASALGGITRVTISVAVIALESTQNFNTSLYCFVVVIMAKLIADSFNIGIYDLCIESKQIPFLVDEIGFEGYQLTLEDVLTPVKPVIGEETFANQTAVRESSMGTLRSVESVANVLKVLRNTPYGHEFLVTNAVSGAFEGTIERLIILRLMEHNLFGEDAKLLHPSSIDSAWPNLRNHISLSAERKAESRLLEKGFVLDKICLDLRPYVDREPPIVLKSGSLRKAHEHIRNGEKNVLIAAPDTVKIMGVVKRHDLMPGFLEATLESRNEFYSRERAMSAENLEHPGTHPSQENRLEEYDPDADLSISDVTNKSATKAKALSLLPFEPRFYELLKYYWDHSNERQEIKNAKKQNRPTTHRYEMIEKRRDYKDVYTMSGR